MPKRRDLEPWEANLIAAIREQHRFGYSIRPMRGKVQVQRFWRDTGKRETVTLPVAWEKGCQRDVLNGINAINDSLQKGLSLKNAAALAFDSEFASVHVVLRAAFASVSVLRRNFKFLLRFRWRRNARLRRCLPG